MIYPAKTEKRHSIASFMGYKTQYSLPPEKFQSGEYEKLGPGL
jgi:hypothetical protein